MKYFVIKTKFQRKNNFQNSGSRFGRPCMISNHEELLAHFNHTGHRTASWRLSAQIDMRGKNITHFPNASILGLPVVGPFKPGPVSAGVRVVSYSCPLSRPSHFTGRCNLKLNQKSEFSLFLERTDEQES